jgi:WD40 repeat protein
MSMKRHTLGAVLASLFLFWTAAAHADVSFSHDIAPILLKRCTGCHGERTNQGGYRAHNFQSLFKAGASGLAPVVAGKPTESILYRRIVTGVEPIRMPKSDDPLSPAQIALVRQWIAEGAKYDAVDKTAPLTSLLGPREHPAAPAAYRSAVPVMAVAFVPGGKEIAVGGYNEVTVWNAMTGALVKRWQHLPERIQALAFSKDGKRLLIGGGTPGEYGEVALVDTTTGQRTVVLDTFNDIVLTAAFSPDGTRIAAGSADASVRVYDAVGRKRLWTAGVHSDWVTGVSFSADGQFLASSSRDMTVKIYEAATGSLYTTYNGHNRQIGPYQGHAPVYAVQFAESGPLAYSAGGGQWIQVWNPVQAKAESGDAGDMEERFARKGHTRYIPHGFNREIFGLLVHGDQLFATSADGRVKQFDAATLSSVRTYEGHTDWVFALDYDAATHRLTTGAYNGEVRIWDAQTGQSLLSFVAQPGQARKTARLASRR